MVHLEGDSSNALFGILEDWNKHLKAEKFELSTRHLDKISEVNILLPKLTKLDVDLSNKSGHDQSLKPLIFHNALG